jgi:hypothetical protein
VGIAEASAVLGISQSVVRRRLKDGRLRGERRHTPQGHVWLVHVPEVAQAAAPAPPAASPTPDGSTVLAELAATREAVTRLEAHNADLRAQVETLTGELTARRREVTELHALVGMVSRALPAPHPVGPVSPPDIPPDDPATNLAADPPGSPAAPDRAADPPGSPPGSPPASRPWWRRAWGWLTAG